MLEYLVRERARVVSKQELSDYLYPHDEDRDSNVLEVLIGRLRRKLDPDGLLAPLKRCADAATASCCSEASTVNSCAPVWAAFAVFWSFLAGAGWAVQQAYTDSVRSQRFAACKPPFTC